MNRRTFCFAMGGFGTASAFGTTAIAQPPTEARHDCLHDYLHERTTQAFGTTVRIIVRHSSMKCAELAISAAFSELELIESLMSIYRSDSQLSRLNRYGYLVSPHKYMRRVLRQAERFAVATNGAFDITVQPLWKAYKLSSNRNSVPDSEAIEQARASVGFRKVEMTDDRIRLSRGTEVTLNGIAQGFATDRVRQVLQSHGVSDALVDAGEVSSIGSKDGTPWKVGIQHPRSDDAYVAVSPLGQRCLATSGDYATTFTDDFRHHHVFDPATGTSPGDWASVSVLAPTAMEADALSTALLVLGPTKGRSLLRNANVDALFVRKDGRISATSGFPVGVSK